MRVLIICGSLRTGSLNRKLVRIVVKSLQSQNVETDEVDLKALALPVYDGDVEAEGVPPAVAALNAQIEKADGVVFVSPEYNSSIPGGLKNALDWSSRGPNPLKGRFAALMGVSAGPFATVRMQPHLRQSLTSQGMWIIPESVGVGMGDSAFADDGSLKDPARMAAVERTLRQLITAIQKHAAA